MKAAAMAAGICEDTRIEWQKDPRKSPQLSESYDRGKMRRLAYIIKASNKKIDEGDTRMIIWAAEREEGTGGVNVFGSGIEIRIKGVDLDAL